MSSATHSSSRYTLRKRVLPVILVALLAAGSVALGWVVGLSAAGESPEEAVSQAVLAALATLVTFGLGVVALPLVKRAVAPADVRVLKAASPVHPLMRRLMAEAPGTYVHSLAVANLVEAGAEAIGADPLVGRVGAYYHDIGKLMRPCFFFENLEEGMNPHDGTKPAASVDIITAHVGEGLELAQRYKLPPEVTDIIREHHGTTLVRYFYHKAAKGGVAVYEADYRYRGVRPQSKEAALVMLADGSEASVRALKDPANSEIEAAIRRVIAERQADGQLDDAGLTEQDIETVVDTFVRYLVSFRHVRCPYPGEPLGGLVADQRAKSSRA